MKKRSALLLLLPLAACDSVTEERVTIGGETYSIPSRQIASINREGHTFVRIQDPTIPFVIVYDSRTEGRLDERGLPRIFSLNDAGGPTIGSRSIPEGTIVCRRAVNPRGGCGLKFHYEGAEWAILFPESQIDRAPQFLDTAETLLEHYEQ